MRFPKLLLIFFLLPIPVLAATNWIKVLGGNKDDCKIVLFDSKAHEQSYSVKHSDKTCNIRRIIDNNCCNSVPIF